MRFNPKAKLDQSQIHIHKNKPRGVKKGKLAVRQSPIQQAAIERLKKVK